MRASPELIQQAIERTHREAVDPYSEWGTVNFRATFKNAQAGAPSGDVLPGIAAARVEAIRRLAVLEDLLCSDS